MVVATKPKEVNIKTTKVYNAILQAWQDGMKGICLEGGTYSSKTYSALQALIVLGSKFNQKLDIDILSESIPHLKGGCIKDFFNILQEVPENNPYYNQTDRIYRGPNWKGVFTFLSADNEKALGMRRDVLFINEGDTLFWEVARELISRTNIFVIIDWNPRSEFWAHEYFLNDPKWAYDHSTYLDALDVIPAGKREDIEDLGRKDPNYYNIYQMGLLGKIESLVYPNFQQVDELPEGFVVYGLDYGYSQDPTVLVKNVIIGDKLYSKEMFYDRSGLTNDQIARKMELAGVRNDPVYPDPDEPKSAEELRRLGFNIQESVKGKGSVEFGIQKVNQYYQHWTKDSLNCIKEQKNYSYIKDRTTGNITDRTTHTWSHGMDSLVAGTLIKTRRGDVPIEQVATSDYVLARQGWKRVLDSFMSSPSKTVYTLKLSNGSSITGTADHLIWVEDKGYVTLTNCRYADIIKVCPSERQLFITDLPTIGILTRLIGRIRHTLGKQEVEKTRERIGIYTDKFGLIPMVRYLMALKYTMLTVIPQTIISTTLSVSQRVGIPLITQPLTLSGSVSGYGNTSGNINTELMYHIEHQRRGSDKSKLLKIFGGVGNITRESVIIAGRNFSQGKSQAVSASAQTTVSRNIAGTVAKTISRWFVNGVASLFRRANINQDSVAPVYVLSVSEPHKDKQSVYDLTVEDIPEFYANGILVHNSRRYPIASIRTVGVAASIPVSNITRRAAVAVSNIRRY